MEFAHFEFNPETDRLGEGPLSEVYKATDKRLDRTVALKVLRAHAEIDPAADQRFHREAKHASNVQHENIAIIYEYGEAHNTAYIAMEYLAGRTLDKIIKDQTIGYEECLRIASQVTTALVHVHDHKLIHRDLKPANIMVLEDGRVKLLDFGIARASNESSITQHGTLVGTVLYMSPEQVRGDELDYRSDIFSLGSVLYHMATGTLPFPGKSFPEVCMAILDGKPARPSEVRSGFPQPFQDLILHCMESEPAARYSSAGELNGALESITSRRPAGVAPAAKIEGKLVLLPVGCGGEVGDACHVMAGSFRKDLAKELGRIKGLSVELVEQDPLPLDVACDFVLNSTLAIELPDATLELSLRPNAVLGDNDIEHSPWDLIEQSDDDEWALQADLVRAATRTIRKRLAELTHSQASEVAAPRNEKRALELAHQAHDQMAKGTSRHLVFANRSLRAALEEDPSCSLAYAATAEALVRQYRSWEPDEAYLEEAREMAEKALRFDPGCAEAHTSLGFAYHISGHLIEAAREYRLAIQLDNDEWLAHRLMGSISAREGNFKRAAGFLRRAIILRPQHIPSYDHLYSVLQRLDRYEESLEVADEGIAAARAHLKTNKDDQETRLYLALLLGRLASNMEARKHVQAALEFAPKDGFTAFRAACVYAVTGDFTDAIDLLTRARDRGFFIQVELRDNSDLDVLRGLPEFRELQA